MKNNKKEQKKGSNKSDNDSIDFNNQVQRTITMWHGQVVQETKKINGVWMQRYAPTRGIRIVSVHARCEYDARTIAANYEGFIPTQTQINQLKWVEVPAEIEVAQ